MPRRLSLVRYRYNAAQVLEEVLRDELNTSDDYDNNDDPCDSSSDSETQSRP